MVNLGKIHFCPVIWIRKKGYNLTLGIVEGPFSLILPQAER